MKETGFYKLIVEMSIMSNNDERVFITDHMIDYKEFDNFKHTLKINSFQNPTFVFCRPIFEEENSKHKIGDSFSYELETNKDSLFLDSLFSFVEKVNSRKEFCILCGIDFNVSDFIYKYIGDSFYDCMSGGMNTDHIRLCKELIKRYNIDTNLNVYPKDQNEWYDLNDWLDEVKNISEFEFKKLPDKEVFKLLETSF